MADIFNTGTKKYETSVMPRPYQAQLITDSLNSLAVHRRVCTQLPTGGGKCLGYGTPVLMYDGTVKEVQNVRIGDVLIGPDSKPRNVLSVCHGKEKMYLVLPVKGDAYAVNESHILSLKITNSQKLGKKQENTYCNGTAYTSGDIANVQILDYLNSSKTFKHRAKGWRAAVSFSANEMPLILNPYFLGIWLGDGNSSSPQITTGDIEVVDFLNSYAEEINCTIRVEDNSKNSKNYFFVEKNHSGRGGSFVNNAFKKYGIHKNKNIPNEYKRATVQERLELVAGFMDSDGSYTGKGYDICLKSEILIDDLIFVCRSLGFSAYKSPCKKKCHNNDKVGDYFRCCISGDVDRIPCKVARKKANPRAQIKNVLVTGIKVEPVGFGDYYGFEIDGDRLFMLGDFTVTHNTIIFNEVIRRCVNKGYNCLVLAHREELIIQPREKLHSACGIVAGLIKSGYEPMPTMPVQIASIQTLTKRNKPQNIKVVVIDEAHHSNAPTYMDIQNEYPNAKIWGLTATPCRRNGEGLEKAFDDLVCGVQIKYLEENGYLVPASAIINPMPPEYFTNCRMTAGDYNEEDLANVMATDEMTNELVENYIKYANGLRNCVFAVNVKHSLKIVEAYRAAGFTAAHVDGKTPAVERNRLFADFKAGKIMILSNVGIATEGVDIPAIECVQGARPTKSLSLFLQMVGRGARILPGKTRYVLLDHANWIIEHGAPNAHRTWTLKGKKINPKEQRVRQFRLIYPNGGGERIVNSLTIPKNLKGVQLIEITDEFRVNTFEKLSRIAATKSFNKWWAFYKWISELETMPSLLELQYIGKKMECKPGWAAFYRDKLQKLDNFKDILTPQAVTN